MKVLEVEGCCSSVTRAPVAKARGPGFDLSEKKFQSRERVASIYLSASKGYKIVHQKYIKTCNSAGTQVKYHAYKYFP